MTKSHNILIQNIKNRDEAAFKAVFDEFYAPLVRFANFYLLDKCEAEDVVQTIFIKIWEKSDELSVKSSIDAYLFTSVKNACLNRLKALKIKDKHDLLMIEGLIHCYSENERAGSNLEEMLIKAIDDLPEGVRKIIRLKYSQDKKISEISEILGISENTVKTQLQRGKQKLKDHLNTSSQMLAIMLINDCIY